MDLRFRCPNVHILREAFSLKGHILLDRCMRMRKMMETGWVVDGHVVRIEYCANEGWMKFAIRSPTDTSAALDAAVALARSVGMTVDKYTVYRDPATFNYEVRFSVKYIQVKTINDAVAIFRRIMPGLCASTYEQMNSTVGVTEFEAITKDGATCGIHCGERDGVMVVRIIGVAADQAPLMAMYADMLSYPLITPDAGGPTAPPHPDGDIEARVQALFDLVVDLEARMRRHFS